MFLVGNFAARPIQVSDYRNSKKQSRQARKRELPVSHRRHRRRIVFPHFVRRSSVVLRGPSGMEGCSSVAPTKQLAHSAPVGIGGEMRTWRVRVSPCSASKHCTTSFLAFLVVVVLLLFHRHHRWHCLSYLARRPSIRCFPAIARLLTRGRRTFIN